MVSATGQLRRLRDIARLRRAGLDIAWSTQLNHQGLERIRFGEGCTIGIGSMVSGGDLQLGDHVLFGSYCNIRALNSHIVFGSGLLCAQFVSFISTNHRIDPDGVPMWQEHDPERVGIVIGDNCWFGVQSVVLPGVELGDRVIVGAGAVVTKSFGSGTRLIGAPARPIA